MVNNSFKVDMIAECTNLKDEDLILHWGISKKNVGEWNAPDDRYLTLDTVRFRDGKACQTKFSRDPSNTAMRHVHLNFWWKEGLEPCVKSMSYVFMEPLRNYWHNNGGRDYCIKFELPSIAPPQEGEAHHHGKIGEVLKEIVESETVYVRFYFFKCL